MEKKENCNAGEQQWRRPQDVRKFRTSDPKEMLNKFLAEKVTKSWTEDFMDNDTGDVVSVERNEFLFENGKFLSNEAVSEIMFCIQAGDIEDVLVSEVNTSLERYIPDCFSPFEVLITQAGIKYKYLVRAQCIEQAIQIAADYATMYLDLQGWYSVKKVSVVDYRVIEDSDNCITEAENEQTTHFEYFNVGLLVRTYSDGTGKAEHTNYNVILKAHDVGQAKDRVSAYAKRKFAEILSHNPNNTFVVLKAKPYDTDGVVPLGYSELYFEKHNQ